LEKVLAGLGVGYFEFFYTVHLLDQRAASLGALPNDLDSASLAVWTTGGMSHLSPATEEAFGAVFTLLLRLYRQVVELVLLSASPPPAIGSSANLEARDE